jgi:uracil phosphoribosyltransferase
MRIARSRAKSFDAFLIERVDRSATLASAPTWSTPGRPWRKRRSADSDAVASTSVVGATACNVTLAAYGGPGCQTLAPMKVTLVDHPLAAERLTILRDATTANAEFRQALDGLAGMLVYEATRALPAAPVEVQTPLGPAAGRRLADVPMLVPILRAGVGLVAAALRLVPQAEVGFVGLARNEETFEPQPYLAKLPERLDGRPTFVLDPMLATGGSLEFTCRLLLERGAPLPINVVCVLAAPEGLERIEKSGIDVVITTAAIDSHLNELAYIVPGLGDAGDRQFGLW